MARKDGSLMPDDKKKEDRTSRFNGKLATTDILKQPVARRRNLNTGTGPMQRGSGRGKARPTVSSATGYRTPMMPKGGAKKKGGPDLTGPASLGGVAGLRRAAAGGALGRLKGSDIREMRIRETDAYRRLQVNKGGRELSRTIAADRAAARTGIGQSSGVGASLKRADLKRVRSWTTNSFPQGEPSGKRPVRFSTPGSLKEANAAGKNYGKGGRNVPRGGGGIGRGGTRSGGGVKGGGGAFLPQQRGFGEQ